MKNNDHKPAFSVIIPTFNRADTLGQAIHSVLNQGYTDFELLVVDDGSTDHTPALVEAISDPRLRYLRQPNRGRTNARNRGAALARGRYITFLDSDDEALPEWLAHFGRAFTDPRVGLVYAGMQVVEPGQPRQVVLPRPAGPVFEHQPGLFGPGGTFGLRQELFRAVGGYVETLVYSENTELALRLIPYCVQNGWRVVGLAEPLLVYYKRPPAAARSAAHCRATLESVQYILQHHGPRLRQHPPAYATWSAVAGVNAACLGHYAQARRFFGAAIRVYPRSWRDYLRLGLTFVPPVRRRIWPEACP